jgi:hypothetical protein
MSPDPVSIHELGSELNPYSYVHGSPLMGVDPDGRIAFLTALIIVGVAAAISAATNTVTQLANNGWNFSQVNWGSVGVSFVVGGLTTAATLGVGSLISAPLASALGSTFGSVASGAVSGAIGGTVSYTATTLMSGGSFDLGDFAKSVAIGSIAGAAGGVGSDLTSHSDKLINSLVGGGSGAIGGFGASLAFGGELSMNSLALSIGMGLASSLATYGVREACVKKFNPGRYLERDPNNEHAYRLNAEGQKALAPAFQHTGKDLSEIRFLPGEIAGDVPGLTLGDTVRLDVDVWNASTSDYRLGLLAHEVTHTVQFDQIGAAEFGARYIEEYALGPGSNYDLPNTLRQTPITEVNMVDRAYTLDQIAQRFAVEVSPSFPVAPHSPPPPKVWAPNPGVVRDGWGAGF